MAEFKQITEASMARATVRGRQVYATPKAVSARFDRRTRRLVVGLDSGLDFSFDPAASQDLAAAAAESLATVVIDGRGGCLHFPALDVDLSVARLLEGFLGPMSWTQREARAAASRENGKRGGRPRKAAVAMAADQG